MFKLIFFTEITEKKGLKLLFYEIVRLNSIFLEVFYIFIETLGRAILDSICWKFIQFAFYVSLYF